MTLGGVSLNLPGVYIYPYNDMRIPGRNVDMVSIPGRVGDVAADTGAFDNVLVDYTVVITDDLTDTLRALNTILFLQSDSGGYRTLTDSRFSDEYRMAVAKTSLTPHVSGELGKYRLTINCKPQRYLNSGNNPITYTATATLTADYRGRPIIKATATNASAKMEFQINDTKITVSPCGYSVVYFDCEARTAYNGTVSLTKYVLIQTGSNLNADYPELLPGGNSIRLLTNCSQLQITPRWWCV